MRRAAARVGVLSLFGSVRVQRILDQVQLSSDQFLGSGPTVRQVFPLQNRFQPNILCMFEFDRQMM